MKEKQGETEAAVPLIPVPLSLSLCGGVAEDETQHISKHSSCASLVKLRFVSWQSD